MELKCIISSAYLKNVAPFSVEKLQLYVHHLCMNVFSVNGILDRQTNKQTKLDIKYCHFFMFYSLVYKYLKFAVDVVNKIALHIWISIKLIKHNIIFKISTKQWNSEINKLLAKKSKFGLLLLHHYKNKSKISSSLTI